MTNEYDHFLCKSGFADNFEGSTTYKKCGRAGISSKASQPCDKDTECPLKDKAGNNFTSSTGEVLYSSCKCTISGSSV